MRAIATFFLLFLALSAAAFAQPEISYIIPDIGAPGMNTYVEIVGPTARTGNFGTIGIYANNASDNVQVVLDDPTQSQHIVVGPLVVSWDGRMISTQVFVKPTAPSGLLVRLKVLVGGTPSNTADFRVVTPQTLGTGGVLSGGGILGSGGAFGTRSARGAMIVDRLTLNGGAYGVQTNSSTEQFPFILISKGPILMQGGATISVNGNTPNAGAGGGGGGGKFCDISGSGGNGGSGFTSGGPGGRNTPNAAATFGTSTGTSGRSLNLVNPGDGAPMAYENAGGGTGHPFGRSGNIWPGTGVDANGWYGGGGGGGQRAGGGGGGYATNGGNGSGSNTVNTAGKVHGNVQGVPVAGGSGGASGNPQVTFGGCGGAGGGGGGAAVLYSMEHFVGNIVLSRGANGENSGSASAGSGGGGSGGYVGMGTKVRLNNNGGAVQLNGGAGGTGGGTGGNGGDGRLRHDGFVVNPPQTLSSSIYVGPSIDTLSYIDSARFTVTGTFNGTNTIRLYVRDEITNTWSFVTPTTVGRTWAAQITTTAPGRMYFAIAQEVTKAPVQLAHAQEPDWVFSQGGANIVTVQFIARINNLDTLRFKTIACEPNIIDSIRVDNTGDAPLNITPSIIAKVAGETPADFSIVTPPNPPYVVAPGAFMWIKVRFNPTSPGLKTATLRLVNNDPRTINGLPRNPRDIHLTGRQRITTTTFVNTAPLQFGDTCVGSTAERTITFTYSGDTLVSIESITRLGTGPAAFTVDPALLATLPRRNLAGSPVTNIPIRVRFTPPTAGTFRDSFQVMTGPCNRPLVFVVEGRGIDISVRVTPASLAFGNVRVNTTASLPITIENTGGSPGVIRNIFLRNVTGPGSFAAPTTLIGRTLQPGENVSGNVDFTPTGSGLVSGTICVVFADGASPFLCPDTVCIDMTGTGVTSLLILSRKSIILRADSCLDPAPDVTDTFKLYNAGATSERITGATATNGLVTLVANPTVPRDLDVGDTIFFTVTWKPGTPGTTTEQIVITSTSVEPNQQRMTVDLTLVRDLSRFEAVMEDLSPIVDPIDFGKTFGCDPVPAPGIVVRNTGTMGEFINTRLTGGASSPFTIFPTTTPFGLAVGGTPQLIRLGFAPTASGVFLDTLVLTNSRCGQEIRIPLRGERYPLTYAVTGIAFGASNVGISKRGTATLQFLPTTPNDVRVNVKEVTIQQSGTEFSIVTPQPMNRQLAPNEVASVDVDFTPSAQTSYNARLCFHIDAPCDTVICVDLNGNGIQSNIIVRQSTVNYGAKYVCQDSTIDVVIENGGAAPLNILDLIIGGTDAVAFTQTSPATKQFAIPPGGTERVSIRFDPSQTTSDGLKTATLEIRSDDAAQPSIIVTLVGERRSQTLVTPTSLDFGRVEVGTSIDRTIVLSNRSDAPVTINSLSLPAPYQIVSPTLPPDQVIAPGADLTITVRFTPTDSLQADALLVVSETTPCIDTTRVPVTGRGKITANGSAFVEIPDSLTGRPGDRIAIPLVLTRSQLLVEAEAKTFVTTIRFRKTMLNPIKARLRGEAGPKAVVGLAGSASIVSNVVEGEDRVVTMRFTIDPPPTAPDTLGFLDATVLLGDSLTTPITFDSLGWENATVSVATDNGRFTLLGYCTIGGDRLIEVSNSFGIKSVSPNPFNPTTEIVFETVENGETSLEIYNGSGELVERLIDREELPVTVHMRVWNAIDMPSGIYYARLVTPTQTSVYRLFVVK